METAKSDPALDALLGTVTKELEESGVHAWRIYPTEYKNGGATIHVSLFYQWKDGSQFTSSSFNFEPDTPLDYISVRVHDAVQTIKELAADEQTEFCDLPRFRKPWNTVDRGVLVGKLTPGQIVYASASVKWVIENEDDFSEVTQYVAVLVGRKIRLVPTEDPDSDREHPFGFPRAIPQPLHATQAGAQTWLAKQLIAAYRDMQGETADKIKKLESWLGKENGENHATQSQT